MPIELVVEELQRKGMVVDWEAFIRAALHADWRLKTIVAKLEEATIDLYTPVERAEFLMRLKLLATKLAFEQLND